MEKLFTILGRQTYMFVVYGMVTIASRHCGQAIFYIVYFVCVRVTYNTLNIWSVNVNQRRFSKYFYSNTRTIYRD